MATGLGGGVMVAVQVLIVPQAIPGTLPTADPASPPPGTVTSPPTAHAHLTATKLHQPPCPDLPHPPCTAQPRKYSTFASQLCRSISAQPHPREAQTRSKSLLCWNLMHTPSPTALRCCLAPGPAAAHQPPWSPRPHQGTIAV